MTVRMRHNESGSVLVWVMVVGLFAVGALGAVTRLLPAGTQLAERDANTTYALIAAESGINYVAHYLQENGTAGLQDLQKRSKLVGDLGGEFNVSADDQYVYVNATFGEPPNQTRRNLRAKVLKERGEPGPPLGFDTTIFAMRAQGTFTHGIVLSGNSKVAGNIGTNGVDTASVKSSGNVTVQGNVYVGPVGQTKAASLVSTSGNTKIRGEIIALTEPKIYPLPTIPEPPGNLPTKDTLVTSGNRGQVTVSQSASYDTINVGPNHKLTFNTGGQDLHVRVSHFIAKGTITIEGGGRLFLYVEDSIDLGSGSFNSGGDPMALVVTYTGTQSLQLSGNFSHSGVFYVKDADVSGSGSLGSDVLLFSGGNNVTLSGNVRFGDNGLVYAPRARVAVSGNATIGIVVGNSVEVSGNADFTYPALDLSAFPLTIPGFGDDVAVEELDTLEWQVCWEECGT